MRRDLNILVVGSGYVGTVTAVELALLTNCNVMGLDINQTKVTKLNSGIPCINEPGLKEDLNKAILHKNLKFTSDYEVIKDADIVIACVGTPTDLEGRVNLSYLENVAAQFAYYHKPNAIFVIKSTVPPDVPGHVDEYISRLDAHNPFCVATCPEFLREGSAISDFKNPERVVFGVPGYITPVQKEMLLETYKWYLDKGEFCHFISRESACLAKYASNAFLATKIAFINSIAEICEECGADVEDVAEIMGRDHRIGSLFLNAGLGFGGSCFPKDTRAITSMYKLPNSIFKQVLEQNNRIITWPIRILAGNVSDWNKKKIGVLGLSFKPDTDDIRESQAIRLLQLLVFKCECKNITAWDQPDTLHNMHDCQFGLADSVECTPDLDKVIDNSEILIIATEWDDIDKRQDKLKEFMQKGGILLDARNMFIPEFESYKNYYRVGKHYKKYFK